MAKCEELLVKARTSPTNLRFTELCRLAICYGFVKGKKQKGSHIRYLNPKHRRGMTFQNDKGMAKLSQIDQLLDAIEELELMPNEVEG